MEAKAKAQELYDKILKAIGGRKFKREGMIDWFGIEAKQCALIAQQNTIDTLTTLIGKFDPLKIPHAYIEDAIETEIGVKEAIEKQ